jgi:NAD-dependent deacetylase
VALTGAGISIASGIPAFRGAQGMWEKYPPEEYATIRAFLNDPVRVWRMLEEMVGVLEKAVPNPAHEGLAILEKMGILRSVITQNVDMLHQAAGSRRVIEFHGNPETLVCLACWKRHPSREKLREGIPPRCACGEVLKPDIVFFGEPIPWRAQEEAEEEVENCRVLLIVGTSAQVWPACDLPRRAKSHGAAVVEINIEETALTRGVADIHLRGEAGEIVGRLTSEVLRLSEGSA